MNQNVHELAKALRDAAAEIEKAARFRMTEEIDLNDAVATIQALKPKHTEAILKIEIVIDGEISVKYGIRESYKDIAECGSLKGCMEVYAASKEGSDSLKPLARLIKKAAQQDAEELTEKIPEPV